MNGIGMKGCDSCKGIAYAQIAVLLFNLYSMQGVLKTSRISESR